MSRWSTTASSRTTRRCARGCATWATSSSRRPTPRSSPTSCIRWCAADSDLFEAVTDAVNQLEGAYALAVISSREPEIVVGSRRGSPLLLGIGVNGTGHGENFLASDTSALLQVTKYVTYLEEGDVVEIRADGYRIADARGPAGASGPSSKAS